ncbi:hypothetical protein ACIGW1_18480 [Streptomyces sp. NPDC053780]|uniref:hypothetical protein n=1 Tax=unclassified Streptomyces TaxID=2593676 RepID=UPI00343B1DCA
MSSNGEWVERFKIEATKDPRVMTRLQEEFASLDEDSLARMRNAAAIGTHVFLTADMEDGTPVFCEVDPASLG